MARPRKGICDCTCYLICSCWVRNKDQRVFLYFGQVLKGRDVPIPSARSPMQLNFVMWRLKLVLPQYEPCVIVTLLASRILMWLLEFFFVNLCTPAQRVILLHLLPNVNLIMVLFSAGNSRTPLTVQGRLVYIMSYTLGLVLLCAYSAAIISFLTVRKTNLPITTFKQLHEDKTYAVRAVRRSSTLEALRVWSLTQTVIQGRTFLERTAEVKTEVHL
jgi:hypothetical protein